MTQRTNDLRTALAPFTQELESLGSIISSVHKNVTLVEESSSTEDTSTFSVSDLSIDTSDAPSEETAASLIDPSLAEVSSIGDLFGEPDQRLSSESSDVPESDLGASMSHIDTAHQTPDTEASGETHEQQGDQSTDAQDAQLQDIEDFGSFSGFENVNPLDEDEPDDSDLLEGLEDLEDLDDLDDLESSQGAIPPPLNMPHLTSPTPPDHPDISEQPDESAPDSSHVSTADPDAEREVEAASVAPPVIEAPTSQTEALNQDDVAADETTSERQLESTDDAAPRVTGELTQPGVLWSTLLEDPRDAYWNTLGLIYSNQQLHFHLETLERVAEVVGALHQSGWVHRDLKPAHVWISAQGDVALIGREALAPLDLLGPHQRLTPRELERTARYEGIVGTPAFMPPELAWAKLVSQGCWTDTYQLGAIAYYILTRRHLHHAISIDLLIDRLTSGKPPQLQEEITPSYHWCLSKAMNPRPLERYSDTSDLIHDLRLARIQMSGERLVKRGHDNRIQLAHLLETHEASQRDPLPVNFSESIRSLRLYHQAERSYWAAVQLSSGDVREEAEIGLQETLETQLKLLTYQGEYGFARRLYQELPTEHPQLLQELEELHSVLSEPESPSEKSSSVSSGSLNVLKPFADTDPQSSTLVKDDDASKTMPNAPLLRTFALDSETVAPIELEPPEGMTFPQNQNEIFDSALDLESDLLELHSLNPDPPPWRMTPESLVKAEPTPASEAEEDTPPIPEPPAAPERSSTQVAQQPQSWEDNLASIGQLFDGELDDDWANEEHSEIIDFPSVSQSTSGTSHAILEPSTSVAPMVERQVTPRKSSKETTETRGMIKPQLTLDPAAIDPSIIAGDENHTSPRAVSTLVTDEDRGGASRKRSLLFILAITCVLAGIFASGLWESIQDPDQFGPNLSGEAPAEFSGAQRAQDALPQTASEGSAPPSETDTASTEVSSPSEINAVALSAAKDQSNETTDIPLTPTPDERPNDSVADSQIQRRVDARGEEDRTPSARDVSADQAKKQSSSAPMPSVSTASQASKPRPRPTPSSVAKSAQSQSSPFSITPDRSRPYTALVSSFKSRVDAERIARKLSGQIQDAAPWIIKVDLGRKGIRYRVLVGQFKSRAEAKGIVSPLKRLKFKPLIRTWIRWVK